MKAALFVAAIDVLAETPPPEGEAAPPQGGSQVFMWVMLIGVAIVMFIMSRRNKKKQGDANAFRSDLAPGQRVMTVSGMVGVVSRVEGDIIVIASDAGDESQWVRRAIRSLVPDDEWEAMTSDYPDDPEEASPDTDDPESPDTDGPDDPDEKA